MLLKQLFRKIILVENVYYYAGGKAENNIDEDFIMEEMNLNNLKYIKENFSEEFSDYKYYLFEKRIRKPSQKLFCIKFCQEIAGYCSISNIDTYESGLRRLISVSNNEVYFFDDYIFEKYRHKNLHHYSIIERINLYQNEKNINFKVVIYNWNKKSIYNYTKNGFKLRYKLFAIRPIKLVLKLHILNKPKDEKV